MIASRAAFYPGRAIAPSRSTFLVMAPRISPKVSDTTAQQLADLTAVVDGLALDAVIPVGHDAGGPAAVNL